MKKFKDTQTEELLHKFIDVQSLHEIKRLLIRHEIADHVNCESFASIMRSIYDSSLANFAFDRTLIQSIRSFTMHEFTSAMWSMSLNKAADQDNVTLEMVRFGSKELHQRILQEYNQMMNEGSFDES